MENSSIKEKTQDIEKDVWSDANKVMAPVLISYFNGEFYPEGVVKHEISEDTKGFIEAGGMDMIEIIPISTPHSYLIEHRNLIIYGNSQGRSDKPSSNSIKKIFEKFYDCKFDDTELNKPFENPTHSGLESIFSEYKNFHLDIQRCSHPVLNPYIMIMAMNVKNRPLAILSLEKSIKSGKINVSNNDCKIECDNISKYSLSECLNKMRLKTYDIISTAKEYNVKEVASIIEDFNRVSDLLYFKEWNKFFFQRW